MLLRRRLVLVLSASASPATTMLLRCCSFDQSPIKPVSFIHSNCETHKRNNLCPDTLAAYKKGKKGNRFYPQILSLPDKQDFRGDSLLLRLCTFILSSLLFLFTQHPEKIFSRWFIQNIWLWSRRLFLCAASVTIPPRVWSSRFLAANSAQPKVAWRRSCECVTSRQDPSTLAVMFDAYSKVREQIHTSNDQSKWPANNIQLQCAAPRRLQMWQTEVHVGQKITAANSWASAPDGWPGAACGNNSPANMEPDTPDRHWVMTGWVLLSSHRQSATHRLHTASCVCLLSVANMILKLLGINRNTLLTLGGNDLSYRSESNGKKEESIALTNWLAEWHKHEWHVIAFVQFIHFIYWKHFHVHSTHLVHFHPIKPIHVFR